MLTFYQKLLIAALLAALCGDIIIFYLEKLLVNPNIRFSFDISGMIERVILIFVIMLGNYYVFFIPLIVLVRAVYLIGEGSFKKFSDIIKREEPAIQFQKIRLKSELAVTLLASPTLGIIFGIIATFF